MKGCGRKTWQYTWGRVSANIGADLCREHIGLGVNWAGLCRYGMGWPDLTGFGLLLIFDELGCPHHFLKLNRLPTEDLCPNDVVQSIMNVFSRISFDKCGSGTGNAWKVFKYLATVASYFTESKRMQRLWSWAIPRPACSCFVDPPNLWMAGVPLRSITTKLR